MEKVQFTGVIQVGQIATRIYTKLPTHVMLHPAAIARMEYQLHPIKEQAILLERFIYANLSNLQRQTSIS